MAGGTGPGCAKRGSDGAAARHALSDRGGDGVAVRQPSLPLWNRTEDGDPGRAHGVVPGMLLTQRRDAGDRTDPEQAVLRARAVRPGGFTTGRTGRCEVVPRPGHICYDAIGRRHHRDRLTPQPQETTSKVSTHTSSQAPLPVSVRVSDVVQRQPFGPMARTRYPVNRTTCPSRTLPIASRTSFVDGIRCMFALLDMISLRGMGYSRTDQK